MIKTQSYFSEDIYLEAILQVADNSGENIPQKTLGRFRLNILNNPGLLKLNAPDHIEYLKLNQML
jgi:hypothetical protein